LWWEEPFAVWATSPDILCIWIPNIVVFRHITVPIPPISSGTGTCVPLSSC
jgi:hypothetical protein